ncbi:hypothetical protein [Flavobacterium sp. LB2R40]|uniref:hypothetical protein n=1 Tax=unclassified Flavobacterium TaxID=196869 RepID=UPI003AB0A0D5
MKNVHYIGFYSKADNPQNFRNFPASTTKMDYIISSLKTADFKVTLLALGETLSKNKLYKQKVQICDQNEKIIYVSTFSNSFFILKYLSRIWLLLQLLYYLLFVVEKNGNVLYYHTYATISIVKISRLFKKFNLTLEVEEIFQAAWRGSEKKINSEIKYLKNGDGYVFVNDIMPQKFVVDNKPFAICYGDYRSTNNIDRMVVNNEEVIKLVYAGVFGCENSDVSLAIDTINFLPEKFQLHILGYGSYEEISYVKNKIEEINYKAGNIRVHYHGKLSGRKYFNFLSTCHIGLSTRVLEDHFSDYTFPSKVLIYLGNNLKTVSSSINCVVKSKVADSIYFYKNPVPQEVAETILAIDFTDKGKDNQIDVLKKLDLEFITQIRNVLNYKP